MKETILVVDDEQVSRFVLREALGKRGYVVEEAPDAEQAIVKVSQSSFDLVLLDIQLPGISGIDAISKLKEIDPTLIIIMITAFSSKEMALGAMKRGAYDYFVKPFKMEEMEIVVKRSLERKRLETEIQSLRDQINHSFIVRNIVGTSGAIQEVMRLIGRVASTTATVMIRGETGTGKELVARAIHQNSPRQKKPMVKLNCAGIPEGLLESELFGFEKGAFTGATERKIGKFELADGGTIFLDEIGDMNLAAQAKILRILQEMEFERLGGVKPVKVDVRVIAATNRDLAEAVKHGAFREDLFHRLNLFSIHVPPLRERIEDVPILAERFLDEANSRFERQVHVISPDAMELLMRYRWPGNVRELKNTIERAVLIADGDTLTAKCFPVQSGTKADNAPRAASVAQGNLDETLRNIEKQLIRDALERADGVQRHAAKLLGITKRVLWYKVKKYGIDVAGNDGEPEEAEGGDAQPHLPNL